MKHSGQHKNCSICGAVKIVNEVEAEERRIITKDRHTPKPWLWPDKTIGKQESGILREEHNEAINQHGELLAELQEATDLLYEYTQYAETMRQEYGRGFFPTSKSGRCPESVVMGNRTAIRKATGETE